MLSTSDGLNLLYFSLLHVTCYNQLHVIYFLSMSFLAWRQPFNRFLETNRILIISRSHSTFACRFLSSRSPLSPSFRHLRLHGGTRPVSQLNRLLCWLPARDHRNHATCKRKEEEPGCKPSTLGAVRLIFFVTNKPTRPRRPTSIWQIIKKNIAIVSRICKNICNIFDKLRDNITKLTKIVIQPWWLSGLRH